jgi:hypothetical protein
MGNLLALHYVERNPLPDAISSEMAHPYKSETSG